MRPLITAIELEKLYLKDEFSLGHISKIKDVSISTVWRNMDKYGIPRRLACGKELVDLFPSPSLAYITGVIYGDGFLHSSRNSYNISLVAKDKDFSEFFAKCIYNIRKSTKPKVTPFKYMKTGRIYNRVKVGSKPLFHYLSGDFDNHRFLIECFPADFIRGFVDSEGSVTIKRSEKRYVGCCVHICNSSIELLKFIQDLFKLRFGITAYINLHTRKGARKVIHGKETHATKNTYLLSIYSKDNIIRFYQAIGFSIKRKRDKLEEVCDFWKQMQ